MRFHLLFLTVTIGHAVLSEILVEDDPFFKGETTTDSSISINYDFEKEVFNTTDMEFPITTTKLPDEVTFFYSSSIEPSSVTSIFSTTEVITSTSSPIQDTAETSITTTNLIPISISSTTQMSPTTYVYNSTSTTTKPPTRNSTISSTTSTVRTVGKFDRTRKKKLRTSTVKYRPKLKKLKLNRPATIKRKHRRRKPKHRQNEPLKDSGPEDWIEDSTEIVLPPNKQINKELIYYGRYHGFGHKVYKCWIHQSCGHSW